MIEIIPAMDIMGGKCVRLEKGDFQRRQIYDGTPLETAARFAGAGLKKLHLVDLDGAREGRIVNLKTLQRIAAGTGLEIDFGGGIRKTDDLHLVFAAGAAQITAGSIAVREREKVISWIKAYGHERIILGADVKAGLIAVSGWSEVSALPLIEFVRSYLEQGLMRVICTDVAKDGMLSGPSFDIYKKLRSEFPSLVIIASGGVRSIEDIVKLNELSVNGVIIGKAIYEGKIKLSELEAFIC